MSRKYLVFAVLTTLFMALDQFSKYLVRTHITLHREEIRLLDGWLSLVHTENQGAAFGMFSDSQYRLVFFGLFTVVAVVVLLHMLRQLPANDMLQSAAIGLIASGALGNAIDRVHKQRVTDFIRVYTDNPKIRAWLVDKVGTNEWPSFNVADAAIVIGLGLFLVEYLFLQKEPKDLAPAPPDKALGDGDDDAKSTVSG